MPIFDYKCNQCGAVKENELVFATDISEIICPICLAVMEKQVFYADVHIDWQTTGDSYGIRPEDFEKKAKEEVAAAFRRGKSNG